MPFTIQSVSKAFVFALALEMVGEQRVAATIGAEPSGEAFNSIRFTNDNRPFNPMVNAGVLDALTAPTVDPPIPGPARRVPENCATFCCLAATPPWNRRLARRRNRSSMVRRWPSS